MAASTRAAPLVDLVDTTAAGSPGLLEALQVGLLFPGAKGPVEARETHCSRVFLTPTDVYKLKKPVDLGFLNYSTTRRRGLMCRAEVSLNQRLAPDIYLGVERVTRQRGGTLELNGRGRVVDYLVHMRRLDDERSLAAMITAGAATADDVRRVGERIGIFHRGAAQAGPGFGPRAFFRIARENLRQLQDVPPDMLPPRLLDEFTAYFEASRLAMRTELDRRAGAGRLRDGHGDLRAEHVYLGDDVTIIDCVEFNRRYRLGDTALDFSFLVMDLTASGYPDLAVPLTQAYEITTGDDLAAVLPLYAWHRALVRAKVAGLLATDDAASERARATAAVGGRRYVYHARRLMRGDSQPLLLLVGGLPGTGKSTLARELSAALGAAVHSADETRKRLAGLGPGVHPETGVDAGLYTDDMNRRVYGSLFTAASDALARGRSVILDATFRRPDDRSAALSLGARAGARVLMIECVAPESVTIARLRQRETAPDPWSDATIETYRAHRQAHDQPADWPPDHLRISTTRPPLEQVDEILALLNR